MSKPQFPIVGIGASAGGVEALKYFFDAMPPDSGAAFVVILHLPPDGSMLPSIISHNTQMPVQQIEEGMRVKPNQVYVIRPAHYVTLDKGVLRLKAPEGRAPNAPVDVLFRSLAAECQQKAIAIILSGMGSNGTLGLREIKAQGGMAIVQDPKTAQFEGMPQNAIDGGMVDDVLPISEMPDALLHYMQHPYTDGKAVEPPPDPSLLEEIARIVRASTNYDFTNYKHGTLSRQIARRMGLRHVESLPDYAKLLKSDAEEVFALRRDLLIRVTSFFRDPKTFESLRESVLPQIIARAEVGETLRMWVPACATGEEAYTLAILTHDVLREMKTRVAVRIFASDVDEESIETARHAFYPRAIAEDVPPQYLQQYFISRGDQFQISTAIRDDVIFSLQDVVDDPPLSKLDLICCRNLLIYLQPEVQQKVIGLLHFGLREGGHLMLGSAETIGDRQDLFRPVVQKRRIYQRIGPTRHADVQFPSGVWEPKFRSKARQHSSSRHTRPHTPDKVFGESQFAGWARRMIMERYAPACVVIDANFSVLYFSGPTHDFLIQPIGEPTANLLQMAREGLADRLRSCVHRANEQQQPVVMDGEVRRGSEMSPIKMAVIPLQAPREAEGLLLISFEDRATAAKNKDDETDPADEPRVEQLEHDLSLTQDDLKNVLHELEASNADHRAAHEEVRSMNEELQSVNEELETTKEELQSVNEELTSVNEQLGGKVNELEASHNDLNNLLRSTDIATVFVDREFCIRRYTPAIQKMYNLIPSDIGRPLSDLAQKLPDSDMLEMVRQVLETLTANEQEIFDDKTDRWFLRSVRPYRTEDDRINGVVITFTDISEQKESALALEQSEELFRTLFDSAGVGIAQVSTKGRFVRVNEEMCRMLGYSTEEFSALSFQNLIQADDLPLVERQAVRLRNREADSFSMESRHLTKADEEIWCSLSVTAVRNKDAKLQYFNCITEDISRRKAAEDQLHTLMQDLEQQIERRTWAVRMLQSVAMIANESVSIDDAFQRTLNTVCEQLTWPIGHVYLPHPDEPNLFVDAGIWCVEHSNRFDEFVEISRTAEFRSGQGLVGRVIESGKPLWIANVLEEDVFLRAESMNGCAIRAGFVFPVLIRDKVVGVLEFFACQASELEPELLDGLTQLGTQLGRVVERKELEKEIADATAGEQQALGQDLHDSVAQQLTGLSMLAERMRLDLVNEKSNTADRAAEIVEQLTQLQQEVRQISHGLMPVEVDPAGLMTALQKLAELSTALYDIPCRFDCPQSVLVEDRRAANQLYRITQEALHNAARHGKPNEVTIRLESSSERGKLSIIDDGCGFDADSQNTNSNGFRIMQYRAGLIQGRLRISSTPGEGTAVACRFPTTH